MCVPYNSRVLFQCATTFGYGETCRLVPRVGFLLEGFSYSN